MLSPGQFGPSLQRLKQTDRDFQGNVGGIINDFHPTEEKMVKISSISTNQPDVYSKTVKNYANRSADESSPVHLWRDSKGLRLFDGNHRVNAALARGETHIKARIWENPYK